jgi:hypothetical protein
VTNPVLKAGIQQTLARVRRDNIEDTDHNVEEGFILDLEDMVTEDASTDEIFDPMAFANTNLFSSWPELNGIIFYRLTYSFINL